MRVKFIIIGIALIIIASSLVPASQDLFVVPSGWPNPIYDFSKNPISAAKIELGTSLFYDPVLSRDNTISCASCHSQYAAFTHIDHALSHGINNTIGTRNSPALVNLAWSNTFMWDGAINHLDMQALAPIAHPAEMGSSIDTLVARLQKYSYYKNLCYRAYGDSMITGERILKAISAFELTIISSNSKYDSVARNESVFSAQEEKGYQLFKKNCATCHTEPLFTNNQFESNALPIDATLNDIGRMKITKDSADFLKFKVPSLRNLEFSYPYMHDGRYKTLYEVVNHYTKDSTKINDHAAKIQLPILLSNNDKVDLISFLLTLSDRSFLFNTKYNFPQKLLGKND